MIWCRLLAAALVIAPIPYFWWTGFWVLAWMGSGVRDWEYAKAIAKDEKFLRVFVSILAHIFLAFGLYSINCLAHELCKVLG